MPGMSPTRTGDKCGLKDRSLSLGLRSGDSSSKNSVKLHGYVSRVYIGRLTVYRPCMTKQMEHGRK